ncbi:MAG TPA: phage virion morphogenesis protein [Pyrinomonadaceae bacterium]|nr:phage virion morphogenesis protein [Pyrinomonadaceae bacterium]
MIRFRATVDNFEVLNRAFNRIDQVISDYRPIWPNVAGEIYAINQEQFDSEGGVGASGKWAALSPAYKKWKEQHYPGQPILRLTNALFESLTDPEAPDAIYRPSRDELAIGSRVPYALAHQRGGRMPQRPIFSFSEPQKRRIQKAIQSSLVEFTRRAGFEVREEQAA